ncbi:MAG: DUF3179 domain-containing protein, partial [Candidatus Zixiibacteriota bacterium]
DGAWVWVNGEDWSYTNWNTGQPDVVDGMDYLQMHQRRDGQWLAAAGEARTFIVEWGCCLGQSTGNADCDPDGKVNILDVARIVDYLYKSFEPLCCYDAANVDGDPGSVVNLLDAVALINYLYVTHEPPEPCPPDIIPPGDPAILVDMTGKEWDISYGVHFYGVDPDNFNFGLGPYAFPPFLDPEFLSPGDTGYPDPNQVIGILGTTINEESRAYPLNELIGHEVVDDRFDSTYVAATY